VIDLRNQGDNLAYQIEKQLKEHGEKVPPEVRGNIESALTNLKEATKSEDGDRIKKAIDNVQQIASKIGEAVYGAQQGQPGGPPPGGGPGAAQPGAAPGGPASGKKDEDVIDAEYEVKE
jgi:molecular chaperone DnaK